MKNPIFVYYIPPSIVQREKSLFSRRMIPPVGSLQKHAEEILPCASVEILGRYHTTGKKRIFPRDN
jgi:hypothetical protein